MNILETLQAYEQLDPLVTRYFQLKGIPSYRDYKFEDGWLYVKVNTSCQCHPEYSWEMECTFEEFAELMQDEVTDEEGEEE